MRARADKTQPANVFGPNKGQVASLHERLLALMKDEDDAAAIGCIREAMRATVTVRANRVDTLGNPVRGVSYKEVPDSALRFAAGVKWLEMKYGTAPKRIEIAPTGEMPELSAADVIRTLMTGAGEVETREIVDAWVSELKRAEPADEPKTAKQPKPLQLAEARELAEV